MRRYRERLRAGAMVVPVVIGEALVEQLASAGFIDPVMSDDRRHVAAAVARVLATLAHESTDV